VKITHIGHACFFLEAQSVRVVTDPFADSVPYRFPAIAADVVTVSHEHHDHNAVERVSGPARGARGPGVHRVSGVEIVGVASVHDDAEGAKRGPNTIFRFSLDGISFAHLGDLGVPLDAEQVTALQGVEVLFVPVGGTYTIDARAAADIVRHLPDVRLVFPMHYRTEQVADWPIAPVDDLLRTMDNVRRIGSSSVALTRETLPEALEVWVLDHA
jgi:L-ascorbate metabolism protein UlaG (beta-lactamase superfamily)